MPSCNKCGMEITEIHYQKYDGRCFECIQKEAFNYALNFSISMCAGIIGVIIFSIFFITNFIYFLLNSLKIEYFVFMTIYGMILILLISVVYFCNKLIKVKHEINNNLEI